MLTEQRKASSKAWIFTSATLGDDEKLSWFTAATGLEDAVTLRLGSPFDYAAHARLWVAAPLSQARTTRATRRRWANWPPPARVRWAGAPSC